MKLSPITINLLALTSVFMTLYGILISINEKSLKGIIIMSLGIILLYVALRLKRNK
jgi:uncharacterized protein (DUF486 family)